MEIKAPISLQNRAEPISNVEADIIIDRCFKKAGSGKSGQLGGDHPSSLVIGGLHLADADLHELESAVSRWFQSHRNRKVDMYFVVILSIGTALEKSPMFPDSLGISTEIRNKQIKNPWYNGEKLRVFLNQ